jgi:hypothetical protein
MKLKKKLKISKKLVALKLVTTKVYTKNKINDIKNDDLFIRLRKSLHIIYKFALSNKKILFIGAPAYFTNQFKKIIKTNRYSFIPSFLWFDGLLTNRPTSKRGIYLYLLRIAQESDLMVVLNSVLHNNSLNEGYVCDIPTISLNCNLSILDERIDYKVPGKFKLGGNKVKNNLFSSILYSIFKKSINVYVKSRRKKSVVKLKKRPKPSNKKKVAFIKIRNVVRILSSRAGNPAERRYGEGIQKRRALNIALEKKYRSFIKKKDASFIAKIKRNFSIKRTKRNLSSKLKTLNIKTNELVVAKKSS